ncbi:MAG: SIMPL domain-containing protein [Alistipes sp.]|nr:SIMPL domain-containing protein [Alistipes sp.]
MKHSWIAVTAVCVAAVGVAAILAHAYTYKYRTQQTVTVTGLGETEFTSDLIVWNGYLRAESSDVINGYEKIESDREKVVNFIESKGIDPSTVVFGFVNVSENYESIYSTQGNYMGQRFKNYELRQEFTIESRDVDLVESVSREISSLIADGVSIDAGMPAYYYTELDNVKQSLIESASADALARASNIVTNAGARLGSLVSARMGVFQITGANSDESFSAGGSFNTSSRHKKARITIRTEYLVK